MTRFGLSGGAIASIEEVLGDTRYFPVHIDFDRDTLTLVETSRDRLSATPFLDGRSPLAEGSALEIGLSEALDIRWEGPEGSDRFIFHVAFCGSTLLATLLDIPGRSFAEREPNVLVELANAASALPPPRLRATLDLMRALLRRPWGGVERNICKPSNWANNLIPSLTAEPERIRPLFLTTDKRGYLNSLFRGGRARMEYVVRATEHLLEGGTASELWHGAVSDVGDPLEVAARIALVCLHVQLELFEDAMRRGGWGDPQLLTLEEIEDDPLAACLSASAALQLDLTKAQLESSVAARTDRYAKTLDELYSPVKRREENRQIECSYGPILDRALDWAVAAGLKNDCDDMVRRLDDGDPETDR